MPPRDKRDFQILKLFMVLATMTVLFVLGLKVVLFAPTAPVGEPQLASPVKGLERHLDLKK